MNKGATYSVDGTLRWTLTRDWAEHGWRVLFLGHNPSTAGHELEDPTTLAWQHFARLWGARGYTAVNLYPFRSPNPKDVYAWVPGRFDAIAENAALVVQEAQKAATVVACYGAIAQDQRLADYLLRAMDCNIYVFGHTAGGVPKHVMARGKHRVPRDQQPLLWRRKA